MWLFIAMIWGTFKITGTRNTLPKEILQEENAWTFGQIIPVLLLAMPLFSMVSQLIPNGATTTSTTGHEVSLLTDVPRRPPYPFSTQHSELPGIITGNYTYKTYWLWPSLVCLFLAILFFVVDAFCLSFNIIYGMGPILSLVQVWFTSFGLLWYIILFLPCAFANVISLGLALDNWLGNPTKLKVRTKLSLFRMLVMGLAVSYAFIWYFLVQGGLLRNPMLSQLLIHISLDSESIYILPNIIICLILDLALYIFYLLTVVPLQLLGRKGCLSKASLPQFSLTVTCGIF